ncbi:hypothetical protein PGT21_023337 [Puccinia graminis f. sp. tritici]|nr:hypothetical protein PGT21_023337 [Puccinia graminis f. sp. tritici]
MMTMVMVSIWVGTVVGGTTTGLDVSKKGAAGLSSSKAAGVAQSLAANPGELSGACQQTISAIAADEALSICTNIFDMVQIRMARDSISAPIKVYIRLPSVLFLLQFLLD